MKRIFSIFFIPFFLFGGEIILPKSFSANFTQIITNQQKEKIIYKGKILYSSPSNLKWSYTSPTKKDVCSNKEEILIVDHDLEQVSAYMIDNGFDLLEIIKKAKPVRPTVYNAVYKEHIYTLQVNQRNELSRVAYKDEVDNSVLIIFENIHSKNQPLHPKDMQCMYPVDYDIIEE
ncbi:MAG: outer-membrane lipoprotein carrier protein LolA [Campylobacterales bacterium]|nr:outer-membrane lipoprotein carrier protein LolA [Campylobacterales bacterium]